jgi:serine/threonine protein kinase
VSLSPGQILNNRYRIESLLGQGGMGAVYKAWDLNLEHDCAIKENFEVKPEAQRQFRREAQILSTISHPNLPRVIDHFIIPEQGQYLVMDFVEGRDLERILAENGGPLPEGQVLPWVEQICDALTYLHTQDQHIIHRDIKPANIFITERRRAKILDFGLAKFSGARQPSGETTLSGMESLTSPGSAVGTIAYMSPEQVRGEELDPRSDLFSFGAVLYEMATGQQAFTGNTSSLIFNAILTAAPAEPKSLNSEIPDDLNRIINRALGPADRSDKRVFCRLLLATPASDHLGF